MLKKEPLARLRPGKGYFLNANCCVVELDQEYIECSGVRKKIIELRGQEKGDIAFNKRLIVPKTMVTGSHKDEFTRLALITSLEKEHYSQEMVAEVLGYQSSTGITHKDLDLEKLVGRKRGECSVLLNMDTLRRFGAVVFSQQLDNELKRKNAVVAYCLGERNYFCADSILFRKAYFNLITDVRVMGGFTVK